MMELDEMKKAWIALDNISRENKRLKETLILDLIKKRAGSSTNKLLGWDIVGFIILILVFIFCVFAYHNFGGRIITWDIAIIFVAVTCAISAVWFIYKINGLLKVNFSKRVSENIYLINRYNILLKWEKIAMSLVVGPLIVILLTSFYIQIKAAIYQWIFLGAMVLLASVLTYWSYKRLYHRNIDEILRSLDEIKELREEEEKEE
ncbi:MAG: hypothetical protein LUH22_12255 [Bacteroides sp.]|nr:hypothetical protein [Bacteroides sp.]